MLACRGSSTKAPDHWEKRVGNVRADGNQIVAFRLCTSIFNLLSTYEMAQRMSRAMFSRDAPAITIHHAAKDIGWQAFGPALACTLLAIAVIAGRWYARSRIARCVGLDDYVILLSVTFSSLITALTALQVHHGHKTSDAASLSPTAIAKLITTNNALWILTVHTTKASILLQYLRIFSNRPTRITCFILLSILLPVVCWGIFAGTFMCRPAAALWNPEVPGHCLNASAYFLSVSGMDIGLDFLILGLPLPSILSLQMPRKQKAALVLVFSLGFFVCVVSVVRLTTVLVASVEGNHVVAGVWAIVWSAVEANVGIVCASLLSLKPLFVKVWPGLFDGDVGSKGSMRLNPVEDAEKGASASSRDIWHTRGSSNVSQALPARPPGAKIVEIASTISTASRETGYEVIQPRRPLHATRERLLVERWNLTGHAAWGTPIVHPALS